MKDMIELRVWPSVVRIIISGHHLAVTSHTWYGLTFGFSICPSFNTLILSVLASLTIDFPELGMRPSHHQLQGLPPPLHKTLARLSATFDTLQMAQWVT